MGNPIPYFPADVDEQRRRDADDAYQGDDQRRRDRRARRSRTATGSSAAAAPSPRRHRSPTLPVRLCLKDGFDPTKLYQLVYTVKDPYVLGAGTAAFRDVRLVLPIRDGGRFRHAEPDRRRDQEGDHPRLVAVGQLHPSPDPPRHERGRGRTHRARRRLAADRRPPRRQQLALGPARRRARALPDGQRRPAMVALVPRPRARHAIPAASSTAASRPTPVRRSSRRSAAPKCSR